MNWLTYHFFYMILKSGCIQLKWIQTYVSTSHVDFFNKPNLTLGIVINWQHPRVARTLQHWKRSNLIVWNFWWKSILVESHTWKVSIHLWINKSPVLLTSLMNRIWHLAQWWTRITRQWIMTLQHRQRSNLLPKHIFWLITAKNEYNLVNQPVLLKILTNQTWHLVLWWTWITSWWMLTLQHRWRSNLMV